jgi:protease-4
MHERWSSGLRQVAVAGLLLTALALPVAGQGIEAPTDAPVGATAEAPGPQQVERDPAVGWLELHEQLREGPVPFAWVPEHEAGPSLAGVLRQLETVAEDPNYRGLVMYLDRPQLSLSQIAAIRSAIQQIRDSGKTVVAFSEQYDLRKYLLASAADLIVLQHNGAVELHGLSIEEMYLAGLLEKVGAQADLLQVGQYKGADEPLTRRGPTEAWSRNMDGLLDGLYGSIIGQIAQGRGMSVDELEAAIAESWTMTDDDYLRSRLVDRISSRDLLDVTEIQFGTDFIWDDAMGQASARTNVNNPFALFQMLFREPTQQTRRPTIAVIHGRGAIHSGESTYGDGAFSDDSIGSATLVEALSEALEDQNIKGVVLRLDSPGGSALASEIIWQAIREVSAQKPVLVSIADMAASGGYYIASAGDRIFVAPEAILGSIGVVSGKIVLGGTYEKLGINVTRRSRGPLSEMFNSVEPFTPEQREVVRGAMRTIYDRFVDRVRIGRGTRLADVSEVAEGRLFTGKQAVDNGMADAVGDLGDAIQALASDLSLEDGRYDVIHLPHPVTLQQFLNDLFGVRSPAPQATAPLQQIDLLGRTLLGDAAWSQVRQTMHGLMLLRTEPVVAIMPRAIVVK